MSKHNTNIEGGYIEVLGARENNLKNIDVVIPRNSLVVFTGLSGSGKSSLAFDTIFAEGQRRYIETFSAYVRHFLGNMERPNVDKIVGLSPVISIDQKTTNKNPRSTVGTTTEIYDFLRLLYARVGQAYSYNTEKLMVKYTEEQILQMLKLQFEGQNISVLAPIVKGRKGHYRELFERIAKKGYLHVRVDGVVQQIMQRMKVDRYKIHDIEVVVDRLQVGEGQEERLSKSISIAMKEGGGNIMIIVEGKDETPFFFSRNLMCPSTGLSYEDPVPSSFSFNSPQGACPKCKGLGVVTNVAMDKIIPDDSLSIKQGGIIPLGKATASSSFFYKLEAIGERYGFNLNTPIKDISEEAMDVIFNGSDIIVFDGILKYISMQQENKTSKKAQKWADQFSIVHTCSLCNGERLNRESLHYFIAGKNIAVLANMDLSELNVWLNQMEEQLSERQQVIATEILKEIKNRLGFLLDVGLDYLSLNRSSRSLSGGESQRIRLATQIGSELVNVLYILDEPSIGLHQRDNKRLINSLIRLRDNGNSIIVVEHDKDMMFAADYIVDIGPGAGRHGGEIVAQGTPEEFVKQKSLTSAYLNGAKQIEVPIKRRKGSGHYLEIKGAKGNNLQNVHAKFPLGQFICVTGVSGSGKSTLINETLYPVISQSLYRSLKDPLMYGEVKGLEFIDKIIDVDQSPIGRTPRSNPATYTSLFTDIRNIYQLLPEAKIRGYKAGRFSFNVAGGKCEVCNGNGYKTIEMNFLPDVMVLCEACHGKRYNRETLEVRYKGKSIADVLDMTINQAVSFFENIPTIMSKLKALQDVGLGYLHLGQSSTTLSGGESQRVKLAAELCKKDTGSTLYILDEPTTGLHFEDIRVLLGVLHKLVDRGNTVLVIEHNLDVIKTADYIIDMGPEGGKGGGQLLFEGTPEDLIKCKKSFTAAFLKDELVQIKTK